MANKPFTSVEQQNAQRIYLHETAVNYQNEADVWSMATSWESTPINTLGVKVPLELSPNPSLSVVDLDGGATPMIGSRDLDNMVINYGQLMQGRGTTYEALLNNNKETAEDQVARALESDMKQMVKFLNDYVSRGNGTAALATASANYLGTNATTKRTFVANGSGDSIGPSQVVVGGVYSIYDSTGTTKRTAGAVASAGCAAGSFKVESKTAANVVFVSGTELPTDYVSGDILVPEIGTANAKTGFIAGLPYLIDSAGTYFGKDRGTVTQLQAYENEVNGALTAAALTATYFGIQQRGGYGFGAGTELIDQLWLLMGVTQKQNYYNLSLASGAVIGGIKTLQQDAKGNTSYDLGYKNFEFTWFGAPIKTCNSVRGDEIYFCNPKFFKKAVLKELGAIADGMPQSGYINLVNADGVPVLTRASYHDFVGQFFAPTPHKLGKMSGITISGLVTQKATMI